MGDSKDKAAKQASLKGKINSQRSALSSENAKLRRIDEKIRRLQAARNKLKREINDLEKFKTEITEKLRSNSSRFSGDRQLKYHEKVNDVKSEVSNVISKHQRNLSLIEAKISSLNEDYQGVDDAIYAARLIIDSLTTQYRNL